VIDAVQTSQHITQDYANELSDKVKALASKHERKALNRRCLVKNRVRSMSDSALYYIDVIHEAIETNRKIRFTYNTYGDENDHTVSPIALVWYENSYVLFCRNSDVLPEYLCENYAVDRMGDIEILNTEREDIEYWSKPKIDEYLSSAPFTKTIVSSSGEATIQLFINLSAVGELPIFIERKMRILSHKEDCITLVVDVDVNDDFFGWVYENDDYIEIQSPDWVIRAIYKRIIIKALECQAKKAKWDKKGIILEKKHLVTIQRYIKSLDKRKGYRSQNKNIGGL
jgi:hypothetical protein